MSAPRVLQAAIAIGIVCVLVWRMDLEGVRGTLRDADALRLGMVVALDAPALLLLGVRSQLALAAMGHRVRAVTVFPAAIVGNVIGSVTPASSGEVLRAALLRAHADLPIADGLSLVLFERGMSLYLLAATTAGAAAVLLLPTAAMTAVIAAVAVLMVAPLLLPRVLGPEESATDGTGSLVTRTMRLARNAIRPLRDAAFYGRWAACTLAIFALNGLQVWLIADSLHAPASGLDAWTALGASQLAGFASLLPFGLGASDGSLAAILSQLGMTLQEGAAIAVLLRVTTTLPVVLVAAGCYLHLATRRASPGSDSGDARAAS